MKKTFLILWILSLVSFGAQFFLLPLMPETVPTHWGLDGTVDGWSGKYSTLFLAALPLLMLLMFAVMPKLDPKGSSYQKHAKAWRIFIFLTILLFICLNWVSNAVIFGYPVRMNQVVPIGIGILFLVLGNYMPQLRQNYTMGIKTPWTLESEWVWKKTHVMGGILFCISGLLLILSGIFFDAHWLSILSFVLLIAGSALLYVYSWYLYRKQLRS